ncbi:hypothetical protein [Hyphomicrobium sp. LHD-15]|uniref:hypothetical protein n=1 Tax=Hyphomicrobium sp. LHD-15 TaxID=3072142 RepID=UPI00280CD778|nr:hypothetical protein [Hyphomicrobium sp. LHD-15]MDQ8697930.1 hypothetical protein [Hyphomicrobium sp. LHD-15]
MSTKTKTVVLAAAALLMTAGASMAAPRYDHRHGGGVNPYERAAIAQARAKVATVKARAWRDGRLTFLERVQIKNAERQLAATIARARRA